ncbi:hypothetical protein BN1723_010732 [Verticillium longisporum]|uniref:Structure-specific endonuclease subunit SLX1 C-terminal domain-containing protein n=1 Tax=Verticillium longisporum TaxID=100787 RepID=A0A0G4L1J7_VERLO|nr:hypothetical protein BN1723_010732 [Verticillium longisporum]
MAGSRNEIGHVHGHLVDLSRVVHWAMDTHILAGNKVDGDTLATKAAATTNTVDVVLAVARQIVVDDQADLLHVDTTCPNIGRDEHTAVALAEVLHNTVALLLRHVAVHAAHGKVGLAHLVRQPVDLAARVAEDDGLCDGQGIVKIAKGVELPVLLLDSDEVLLETLKGQLVTLDKNAHRVGHELGGHVEDVIRQRGADDDDLGGGREVAIHVLHFFVKTAHKAWEGSCAAAEKPVRKGLQILTDFGPGGTMATDAEAAGEAGESSTAAPGTDENWGVHALPLDHAPMKDFVEKGRSIVTFEREGACVVCKEPLEHGRGLHVICSNGSCEGAGHLSCWSRHLLAQESSEEAVLPVAGPCPCCRSEVRWDDLMRELSLRVRGEGEVDKLLKVKKKRQAKT